MRIGGFVADEPLVRARLQPTLTCVVSFTSVGELRRCLFGADGPARPDEPSSNEVAVAAIWF